MNKKWLTPILPYLAVWMGFFCFPNAWAALIGFHAAIVISIWVTRTAIPVNTLFRSKNFRWILVSVLIGSSSGIGLYFLWNIFGVASDLPAQLRSIGLTSSAWPIFIVYFVLVNPFIEEYFWRSILASGTKQLYFIDLIYAGYHAMILWGKVHPLSIVFAVLILTLAGWFWRQVARRDNGLLAPVLGHMAADLSILLTVCWMCT